MRLADPCGEPERRVEPAIGGRGNAQLGPGQEPPILQAAAFRVARDAASLGRRDATGTPARRSSNETEPETGDAGGTGDAARDSPRQSAGADPEHRRRQYR